MRRITAATGAALSLLAAGTLFATGAAAESRPAASTSCLPSGVKHIIEIQFDNVHLRRDNPTVPSDLEQMPNLLNFLEENGVVLTNHHTPLISHTADDIITTLTGVYGEKHGQPVSNSYGFFRPDGSVGFSSSFVYWTDIAPDGQPQMVDQRGKIHPAPWVPFTRNGCDAGAFSVANIEFENISTDINNVFGPTSPEAAEAKATPAKAIADFEGIAVHCAQNSPICAQHAKLDLLPDEPGGYVGFNALFGNRNVAPQINHGQPSVNDLDGRVIADDNGNVGFPGFDPTASQTLGYLATMLEAGVPVVYGYIADAHDSHSGNGSFGPGETGYVEQLAAYNESFGKFFARLKQDGITKENTVFIITSDENDHFAGRAGAPAGCDGIHTPCTYIRIPAGCDGDVIPCTTTNLGEVNADLRALLLTEFPGSTPPLFSVHSDDAPTLYIVGQPGPDAGVTRTLERQMGALQAFDPIVGQAGQNIPLTAAMAGPTEMALLHMVTHDAARTPTFTYFANPDFFLTASTKATACSSLMVAPCSNEQPSFNWNHGDFQEDITRTWLGMVGPGIRRLGRFGAIFSDHTDVRPTVLSLAGLKDDYTHDGRVLFDVLDENALPRSLREPEGLLSRFASAYKAINAPRGTLGRKSLAIATRELNGDEATFAALEAKLGGIVQRRNAIAQAMITALDDAAFNGQRIDERAAIRLIEEADELIEEVQGDHDAAIHGME